MFPQEKSSGIRILQETDRWIAVRKPAGLAVQTKRIREADLESEVRKLLRPAGAALFVINRLDQPVEGIVLFAKDTKTAAMLSGQMQGRKMVKEYLACVSLKEEVPGSADGQTTWHTLTDYLVKDGRTNTSRVVSQNTPGARKATLDWRLLRKNGDTAILAIRLGTGRHHQIRVQLSHAGMPILGDHKYAEPATADGQVPDLPEYPALCACRLSFADPDTGSRIDLQVQPENECLVSPDLFSGFC